MRNFLLYEPRILYKEISNVNECLKSGWLSPAGNFVKSFEMVLKWLNFVIVLGSPRRCPPPCPKRLASVGGSVCGVVSSPQSARPTPTAVGRWCWVTSTALPHTLAAATATELSSRVGAGWRARPLTHTLGTVPDQTW